MGAGGSFIGFDIDSVRIDLNCRTPSWSLRIAYQCEVQARTYTHIHTLELKTRTLLAEKIIHCFT